MIVGFGILVVIGGISTIVGPAFRPEADWRKPDDDTETDYGDNSTRRPPAPVAGASSSAPSLPA